MDINKILVELRQEHEQITEAILSLERLAAGSGAKRRGRPPAWMAHLKGERRGPGRPPGSKNKKPVNSEE